MTATIAFIGLGNMGGPMAGNLVKAGFQVRGFDLSAAARDAAAARGVTAFDDLTAAVTGADAVITMLPNGALVKQVWGQIAAAVTPGTVLIDSDRTDDLSRPDAYTTRFAGTCPAKCASIPSRRISAMLIRASIVELPICGVMKTFDRSR